MNNIHGDRILVELIYEGKRPVTNENIWNGKAKVIKVGDGDLFKKIKEGQEILVTSTQEVHGEHYVLPTQLLKY